MEKSLEPLNLKVLGTIEEDGTHGKEKVLYVTRPAGTPDVVRYDRMKEIAQMCEAHGATVMKVIDNPSAFEALKNADATSRRAIGTTLEFHPLETRQSAEL